MSEANTNRPVTVHLTGRDSKTAAELLIDVIDFFTDGFEEAKTNTIEDKSLPSMEDLLELCGSFDDMTRILDGIREQLKALT